MENITLTDVLNVPLDYKIKLAPSETTEQEKELFHSESNIKMSLARIGKQFLIIGEELKKIRDEKLYKLRKGTFEDYCEKTLNLTSSTCYKFIQIYEFVATSPQKLDNYSQYSYSQLREMVTINKPELLNRITPDMTIKQIRQLKTEEIKLPEIVKNMEAKQQKEKDNIAKLYLQAQEIANKDKEEAKIFAEVQKQNEPKSLVLKNKKERQEFLDNFKSWTMVAYIQQINLKIYKYELKNGVSIWAFHILDSAYCRSVKYSLYIKSKAKNYGYRFLLGYFNLSWNSENEIIDWLTQNKKEIE